MGVSSSIYLHTITHSLPWTTSQNSTGATDLRGTILQQGQKATDTLAIHPYSLMNIRHPLQDLAFTAPEQVIRE